MAEDRSSILMRIHAAWPGVAVTQDGDGAPYHAVVPVPPDGKIVVQRSDLGLLEDKIGEVMNGLERERRRAAAAPGGTI